MFEEIRLLGTPEIRIVVQTRARRNLDAILGPEPSAQCHNNFKLLQSKYGKSWLGVRKPPTGGYNCAGMVWATRRAHLPTPEDWQMILTDDGYREIREADAEIGDIVVYYRICDNLPSHVGRVCRIDRLLVGNSKAGQPNPRILSKWDVTSGECIHAVTDVHLDGGEPVKPRFFTDR
jgi:hypothetical protein